MFFKRVISFLKGLGNRGTSAGMIAGITWGGLAAAGSAGAGIYGAVNQGINSRKAGAQGRGGYDMYIPQAVGEQTGIGKENVQYLGGMRQALEAGSPWANYGTFEQQMRRKQQRMQQEAMYGNQGDRYGAYQTGMESGALTGLGGGQTQRSLRPLMNTYLQGGQQIEEMLAQAKAGAMQNKESMYLQGMNQMAQPFGGGMAIPWQTPGAPQTQQADWGGVASNLKDLSGTFSNWGDSGGGTPDLWGRSPTGQYTSVSEPWNVTRQIQLTGNRAPMTNRPTNIQW